MWGKDKPPRRVTDRVCGWRTWSLSVWSPTQETLLRGQHGQYWREPQMKAEHIGTYVYGFTVVGGNVVPHDMSDVPHKDCRCGIWVSKIGVESQYWSQNQSVSVQGYVEIWGKGFEGPLGYRAQHAKIVGPLTIDLRCCGRIDTRTDPDGVVRSSPCVNDVFRIYRSGTGYLAYCPQHAPSSYPMVTPSQYYKSDQSDKIFSLREFSDKILTNLQERYGCEIWLWDQLLEDY